MTEQMGGSEGEGVGAGVVEEGVAGTHWGSQTSRWR